MLLHNDATFVHHYKQLEDQFFYNVLQPDQQQLLAMQDLHDAYLFGEMGFLIAGLKPCVLIDLPHAVARLYKQHVLDQVFKDDLLPRGIEMVEIKGNVSSPEISLQGCFIVYHKDQKDIVQPLLSPVDSSISSNKNSDQQVISEPTLAKILDYPGSLPSNPHEVLCMMEVVYYTRETEQSAVQIITTFAALDHEVEQVKAHFQEYRTICREKLGLDIELLIRRPR
ncbi:hypothetical protein BDA99DRAFT_509554 [Phascolomyces articulosus]|uniref:Uncharacterized protein n=1 Tax=Phascolomyces articulosus TaxID=60185 RepID=A0AAD5K040_9FUNG|nr:hypothetical protein BDA99DRAFT_509554 [Phascolomyces articulosus]